VGKNGRARVFINSRWKSSVKVYKYACPALSLWVFGCGLGLGDFVWNERAVAFERVVDEITRRHTVRY